MVKTYLKKYLTLVVGLFIVSLGIAVSVKADLGTSPVSSVPYTVSLIAPLTVGQGTILMHCVFILLQVAILGKKYRPFQLLQLVVALVFGEMCDFSLYLLSFVSYSNYFMQWVLCIIGIVLVALGVTLEVKADAIPLALEGLSLAVCERWGFKFGNVKVCFDVSLVIIAVIIGFVFKGKLLGVREGTVAAAVCVGLLSKGMLRIYDAVVKKDLCKHNA